MATPTQQPTWDPYPHIPGYTRQDTAGWRPQSEKSPPAAADSTWTHEDGLNLVASLTAYLGSPKCATSAPLPAQNTAAPDAVVVRKESQPTARVMAPPPRQSQQIAAGSGGVRPHPPQVRQPPALLPLGSSMAQSMSSSSVAPAVKPQQSHKFEFGGQQAIGVLRTIRNDIVSTTLRVTVRRVESGVLEMSLSGIHRIKGSPATIDQRAEMWKRVRGHEVHGQMWTDTIYQYINNLNHIATPDGTAARIEVYGRMADAVLECILLNPTKFTINGELRPDGSILAHLKNFNVQRALPQPGGPPGGFGQAVVNIFSSRLLQRQVNHQGILVYRLNDDEIQYSRRQAPLPAPSQPQVAGKSAVRTPPVSAAAPPMVAQSASSVMSMPASDSRILPPPIDKKIRNWREQIDYRNLLEPTLYLRMFHEVNGIVMNIEGFSRHQPFDQSLIDAVKNVLSLQNIHKFNEAPPILSHSGRLTNWRNKMENFAAGQIPVQAFGREASGILNALGDQNPTTLISEKDITGLTKLKLGGIRVPPDFVNVSERCVRERYNNWQNRVGEVIPNTEDELHLIGLLHTSANASRAAYSAGHGNASLRPQGAATHADPQAQRALGLKRKTIEHSDQDTVCKVQKQSQFQNAGQVHNTQHGSSAQVSNVSHFTAQPYHTAVPAPTLPPTQEVQGVKRKLNEFSDQNDPHKAQKHLMNQTPAQAQRQTSVQATKITAQVHNAPLPLTTASPHFAGPQTGSTTPVGVGQQTTPQQTEMPRDDETAAVPGDNAAMADKPSDATDDDDLFGDIGDDLFGDGEDLFGEKINTPQAAKQPYPPVQTMPPPGLALPPPRKYPGLTLPPTIPEARAAGIPPPLEAPRHPMPTRFNAAPASATPIPSQPAQSAEEEQTAKNKVAQEAYLASCLAKGIPPEMRHLTRIANTKHPNAPKKAEDSPHPSVAEMIRWCANGQLADKENKGPTCHQMRNFLKDGPKEWRNGIFGVGFGKVKLEERLMELYEEGILARYVSLRDGSIVLDPNAAPVVPKGQRNAATAGGMQMDQAYRPQALVMMPTNGYATAHQPTPQSPLYGASYVPNYGATAATPQQPPRQPLPYGASYAPSYGAPPAPQPQQQPLPYGASYASDYGATPPQSRTQMNTYTAPAPQSRIPLAVDNNIDPLLLNPAPPQAPPTTTTTTTPAPTKKPRKSRAKSTLNDSSTSPQPTGVKKPKKQRKADSKYTQEELAAMQEFLIVNNGALGKQRGMNAKIEEDELVGMVKAAEMTKASREGGMMGRRDSGVGGLLGDEFYAEFGTEEEEE
ncbi:unnamed protein product [Zymoseptoria tritici ST99CH_1A5]|uniref:Uncharacterized protein n=1 Tax=Zymoseptoria tritici ST99CH_1A5 TaxID=1276529 RepID=A0A1Y6LLR0_ZYMTR|nr:unnamed protein product [Zymoseptoria tritici ST99CH_1A5]